MVHSSLHYKKKNDQKGIHNLNIKESGQTYSTVIKFDSPKANTILGPSNQGSPDHISVVTRYMINQAPYEKRFGNSEHCETG